MQTTHRTEFDEDYRPITQAAFELDPDDTEAPSGVAAEHDSASGAAITTAEQPSVIEEYVEANVTQLEDHSKPVRARGELSNAQIQARDKRKANAQVKKDVSRFLPPGKKLLGIVVDADNTKFKPSDYSERVAALLVNPITGLLDDRMLKLSAEKMVALVHKELGERYHKATKVDINYWNKRRPIEVKAAISTPSVGKMIRKLKSMNIEVTQPETQTVAAVFRAVPRPPCG